MKGYLANGLFSLGDRMVNRVIATQLRGAYREITGEQLDLFVPQEQTINDKSSYADSVMIAKLDSESLMTSDFLVAVIDGVEIDSGVAAEIGMYSTTGKPIFALYTDIRQGGRDNTQKIGALIEDCTENQFMYRNLFVVGLVKQNGAVFLDIDSLIEDFMTYVKEDINNG
ncbi:nucleoside 2-deoxyribosyltransferase [Paenibacillus agilis]|uniref:Nucleoside 2-deoxyribosyltransferase n=2 Tax=Paenibacillus agilis TaxID=3020863 RepID=A0A559IEM8_9BACL|nr:nucleoside 2-deoxyribosyltransferase [Paenibacillus agilis]